MFIFFRELLPDVPIIELDNMIYNDESTLIKIASKRKKNKTTYLDTKTEYEEAMVLLLR